MLQLRVLLSVVLAVTFSANGVGQQKAQVASAVTGTQEFPVVLQHGVAAGKTAPGTKVEAKLAMATLVNGTVIPKDALLSGEVIESAAKTRTEPSRLGIRFDSATWKGGNTSLKLYVTPWYYPTEMEAGQDLEYGPPKPPSATWNGAGEYPSRNTEGYKPFPSAGSDKGSAAPNTPNPVQSKHALRMKNVDEAKSSEGDIVLVSRHSNVKLERFTTYVASSVDAAGPK